MLEVQLSKKDGNRLYAKTTSSQLLVYDLDEGRITRAPPPKR
jgi:hypothetical protein